MAESKTVTSGADDHKPRAPTASLERVQHGMHGGSQAVQQSGKDSRPIQDKKFSIQYARISKKAGLCATCMKRPAYFVFYYDEDRRRGYRVCWEDMTPGQRGFIKDAIFSARD